MGQQMIHGHTTLIYQSCIYMWSNLINMSKIL